jgi:alpha-L-rhamnosidase
MHASSSQQEDCHARKAACGPFGGGPHFSGGTIGLASIVRALMDGRRDDVLWNVVQEDTAPSYGFFLASTTAIPLA